MWSYYIGSVAGIRVRIHFSFAIFFIVIGLIEALRNGVGAALLVCLLLLLAFLFVLLHELAHSLVAQHYGMEVRDITLWPLGGIAMIEEHHQNPILEIKIAAAGPLLNFAFAFVLLPFAFISHIFAEAHKVGFWQGVNIVFLDMILINLGLMLFNLIPAFPMDGGRIYRSYLALETTYLEATRKAKQLGMILAIAMVCLGILFFEPILFLVGIFVILGSQEEYRRVETKYSLESPKPFYFFYYDPNQTHMHASFQYPDIEIQKEWEKIQSFFQNLWNQRRN